MNLLLLSIISLIWGSSFILMKWAAAAFSPLAVCSFRLLLGGGFLAILWRLGRGRSTFKKTHISALALLCLIGYIYPFSIQPYLVTMYDSGFIAMVLPLVPILTIAVSIPMLNQLPTRWEVIGVVGGLGFSLLLFKDGLDRDFEISHLLLLLTVPLTYSIGNTMVKSSFHTVSPLVLSCIAMLVSGIALLPMAVGGETVSGAGSLTKASISLLGLGIFATGLATHFFYMLIKRAGPVKAGTVGYLVPFLALFWGWMDGERLTGLQFFSLAGILAMVGLSQKGTRPGKNQLG